MAQAVTERDKYDEARRQDLKKNLKDDSVTDDDRSQATANHAGRLPSDVSSFALQHGLSESEAERAMDAVRDGAKVDAAVAEQVEGRTVYRPVYVKTPAGVSDPLAAVSSASVPLPPDPDLLDPNAPNPDEPTGHVAGREREDSTVADEFAEAVERSVEDTDETQAQLEDVDTPEVPVE